MTEITASNVNRAIAAKYSGDEWRVWFEVSQSTGHYSGRRADAVVMNLWPSKQHQIHVMEVKVTRGDFMNEMKDLTKWEAIGQFANFFWLCTPVGLVSVDEVPKSWGLMELTKGGLRVKKQAPANTSPKEITKGFAASLLRSGESLTSKEIDKRVEDRVASEIVSIKNRLEKQQAQMNENRDRKTEALEKWVADFEAILGQPLQTFQAPSQVVANLRLAEQLKGHQITHLKNSLKTLLDTVEYTINPTQQ